MRRLATAKEIAGAIEKHETTVARRLKKLRTLFIWRKGKGGNEKHYVVAMLPRDYRIALAAKDARPALGNPTDLDGQIGAEAAQELLSNHAINEEAARIAQEEGLAAFEQLPPQKKLEANARYSFLKMCDGFVEAAGFEIRRHAMRSRVGDEAFVKAYNEGKIKVDEEILAVIGKKTSYSTIKRIADNHRKYGKVGLANNYHNPKRGSTSLSEEMQNFVIGAMCKEPKTSSENLRRALQGACGCMDVPSVHAITRFRNRWIKDNQDLWLFYTNPDAWESKKMFAFGSASENVVELNQLWEADSTPADLMLTDGRHSIIGMIDVYSRRVRFVVSKTSRAQSIIALTRQCLIDWGVPKVLKTDNGKDYLSKHVVRVLLDIGVEQQPCKPFSGEEKPHIERVFKTFLHGLVELLPGFIGHNVAERKAIEARKSFAERVMKKNGNPVDVSMSSKDLQKFCDEWTNFIYHQDPHDGLNGRTPAEMVRNWNGQIRRINNLRALDMLLMPATRDGGMRKIRKKGIRIDGRFYRSAEFAGYVGEKVFVLQDPTDLGTVYVYLQNERGERSFLCPAIDPVWLGIDLAEFAVRSKKHQEKIMKEQKRELDKISKEAAVQEALNDYVGLRKSQVDNIVDFPVASEEHSTDALEEAAKAAVSISETIKEYKGSDVVNVSGVTLDLDKVREEVQAPLEKNSKITLIRGDVDTYLQLRDTVRDNGRKLTPKEIAWIEYFYEETESGKSFRALEGDLREMTGMQDGMRVSK